MNNLEEIKRLITPFMVSQHYLGQGKQQGNKVWYKSPFRNERTASFMVTEDGFHDFGDGWHGDIIDFVGRYYNTDFVNAVKILSRDFGLPENEKISTELIKYKKQKRDEEQKIKQSIEIWYCNTLNNLCAELHKWTRMLPYLKGEALAIAYNKIQYLDYLIDELINTTENGKIELWKDKEDIEKCLK